MWWLARRFLLSDSLSMLQRIKRIAANRGHKGRAVARWQLEPAQLVWAVGSLCALNRVPFDAELLLRQFPPPYITDTLIHVIRALGFRIKLKLLEASALSEAETPCLALLVPPKDEASAVAESPAAVDASTKEAVMPGARLGLITDVSQGRVQYFDAGSNSPTELSCEGFAERYLGVVFLVVKGRPSVRDPDVLGDSTRFGFRWFVPDLLKHKKVYLADYRHPESRGQRTAPLLRCRPAGDRAFLRYSLRQPACRQPACHLRAHRPSGKTGRDPRCHRETLQRLPDRDRRARQWAVRRSAPAIGDCPRALEAPKNSHLRRSHQCARPATAAGTFSTVVPVPTPWRVGQATTTTSSTTPAIR